MNSFLTEMYNTGENIGVIGGGVAQDIEKLAEAELLNDLFREEGVDVDTMSPEQIVKIASQIFGDDSPLVKAAQAAGAEACDCGKEGCECPKGKCKCAEAAPAKTAAAAAAPAAAAEAAPAGDESLEEKIAHADSMGRIMAHSFIDEWAKMEKAAQVEMVKQAKIEQLQGAEQPAATEQPQATGAEALIAKIAAAAGNTAAAPAATEPAVDPEKIAAALALLKEAGVPFPQA